MVSSSILKIANKRTPPPLTIYPPSWRGADANRIAPPQQNKTKSNKKEKGDLQNGNY